MRVGEKTRMDVSCRKAILGAQIFLTAAVPFLEANVLMMCALDS